VAAVASTAAVLCFAQQVLAGGLPVLLYTQQEWQTALGDGRITPVGEGGGGMAYEILFRNEYPSFVQVTPELMALTDSQSGGLGDGLLMHWGDPSINEESPQLAAWEYEFPLDPDLTGRTLNISIVPPGALPPAGLPPILSVALVLNDAAGGWAAWAWNVTWPPPPPGGPLYAAQQNNIVLDPNIMGFQGASLFAVAPWSFDPKQTVSIQAAELAVGAAGWAAFPPVPVVTGVKPWNYWGNLVIVPEPTEIAAITATLLLGLALLRRRNG